MEEKYIIIHGYDNTASIPLNKTRLLEELQYCGSDVTVYEICREIKTKTRIELDPDITEG